MTTPKPIKILFDAAHNEEIRIEDPEVSKLVQLLEKNGISAHTNKMPLSIRKISQYQIVIIGNPLDSKLAPSEIKALVSFVKSGGGLLLLSGATIFGKGGDSARKTNLNEVARNFNFEFSKKAVIRSEQIDDLEGKTMDDIIVATPVARHPICEGIRHLLFSSSTSILAETSLTHLFRAADLPSKPIIVVLGEANKGRVVGIGGTTPFFNNYIEDESNELFVIRTLRWLMGIPPSQPVHKLNEELEEAPEIPSLELIAELGMRLDRIENELNSLKNIIKTSLKELEKIIQQVQEKKDQT